MTSFCDAFIASGFLASVMQARIPKYCWWLAFAVAVLVNISIVVVLAMYGLLCHQVDLALLGLVEVALVLYMIALYKIRQAPAEIRVAAHVRASSYILNLVMTMLPGFIGQSFKKNACVWDHKVSLPWWDILGALNGALNVATYWFWLRRDRVDASCASGITDLERSFLYSFYFNLTPGIPQDEFLQKQLVAEAVDEMRRVRKETLDEMPRVRKEPLDEMPDVDEAVRKEPLGEMPDVDEAEPVTMSPSEKFRQEAVWCCLVVVSALVTGSTLWQLIFWFCRLVL